MGCVGIIVPERQFAVRVRHVQPVHLGERHRLDDGEALLGAVPEVAFGLLAAGAVEQLPRGVAKPEERRAVAVTRNRRFSDTRSCGRSSAARVRRGKPMLIATIRNPRSRARVMVLIMRRGCHVGQRSERAALDSKRFGARAGCRAMAGTWREQRRVICG